MKPWGDGCMDGWTNRWTDGYLEIQPCVLQDIGPLGPLPKKEDRKTIRKREGRAR